MVKIIFKFILFPLFRDFKSTSIQLFLINLYNSMNHIYDEKMTGSKDKDKDKHIYKKNLYLAFSKSRRFVTFIN